MSLTIRAMMATVAVSALVPAMAYAADTQSAASTASNAASTTDSVQEVIVTATRRDERVHDIPAQVSALSGKTLESLNVKSLADFSAFTPGLSFQSASPSSNIVAIRGVTTGEKQLNSAIGLYLDDVPLGATTPGGVGANTPNIGMFDLNRVEVLNGPQGTLFGADALGGTLRYITNTPDLNAFSGVVEGEGSYTEHGGGSGAVRAEINAPIINDTLGIRASAVDETDSGYINDPTHGRQGLGDGRIAQGHLALLYRPTDDLSVQLSGFSESILSNGQDMSYRSQMTGKPVLGTYDTSLAVNQPSRSDLYLASAVINDDLHWAKLTAVTGWQRNKFYAASDYSAVESAIFTTPPPLGPGLSPAVADQPYLGLLDVQTDRFTQELRLTSPSKQRIEWVTGVFYSYERSSETIAISNTADPNGYFLIPGLFRIPLGQYHIPSTAGEIALYGDGTLHITSQLDATVGVRYSWNNQTFASSGYGLIVSGNPFTAFTPITRTGTANGQVPTYLFNLRYRPTTSTMVYVRIANGYRPGGPNLVFAGAGTGNLTFGPDHLWNYEIGLRQSFDHGRSFVNLSGYHIDWSSIQQVTYLAASGAIPQFINGGNAAIDGIEASASVHLIGGLKVVASSDYTNARLTDPVPDVGVDYSGARLPITPKFSITAAPTYDFDIGSSVKGTAILSFRYTGDRTAGYAGSTILPLYKLPAYELVDFDLSLRGANGWSVSPYIKNIFASTGQIAPSPFFNRGQVAASTPIPVTIVQPRTFGVVLRKSI